MKYVVNFLSELSGKFVIVTPKQKTQQKSFSKIKDSFMFDKLWADPDAGDT